MACFLAVCLIRAEKTIDEQEEWKCFKICKKGRVSVCVSVSVCVCVCGITVT